MIDKTESVNWPNVWWILGADHLTFEGLWVISEKMSCRLISRGKKACKWIPGKKIILHWKSLMTYNAEKNLIPLYVGEEISNSREVWEKTLPQYKLNQYNHPYPTPPQTSNGHVKHLEGEERNGFDTLVNVIHQQNGWRAFVMWWFTRLKFCILRLKVRR